MRTFWHCHIAVSLDGRIARPDGSFDWLEPYPAEEFGIEAFLAEVDAILMGRGTYDVVRGAADWPYAGKDVVVVTNRPLQEAPDRVTARGGDIAAIAAEMEARGYRRVWVEGGGQVIRQVLAIGKLDRLEMAVIPRVLGAGIPLFPQGTPETALRLVSCVPRAGGALHVIYDRA
ncbi:dihydrofolate reductase family protein [Falsiroseomonas oryziterrae]|uniref:dihydrofolate reductase family protein n=1 Tax=Falsiroseomonas oryziterrae TaxID=2911368 RepID=UPI001F3C8BB7|nr:dihydrofolate reductase family protein [Roseomonas sp. NPKOSM-4]